MSDLCFDVFRISKEKKDPKLVNGHRELLDALTRKQRCDDECDSSFDDSSLNEEISEKQRERRAQNKYLDQISHKGYARLAEEIKNELCNYNEINRAILWKKGRLNKEGEFVGDQLRATIAKIVANICFFVHCRMMV